MKMIKALAAILLIGMLLGSSFLATENTRGWDASSLTLSPKSVTEGDTVTFSVTVPNTGSDSMKITYVFINFDWLPSDKGYSSHDVPQILASGASYKFTFVVPIPNGITTHTSHSVIIRIDAEDPGIIEDWSAPTTKEYTAGSVFVETPPPPSTNTPSDGGSSGDSGSSDNGSPGFTAVSAVGVVGIISLVAIMRKKKAL